MAQCWRRAPGGTRWGWRLPKFQTDYDAVKTRRSGLDQANRKGDKASRKKLLVGLARQFIVDWWRIRTKRTTPEKLGLQMSWPAAYVLRAKKPLPTRSEEAAAA